MPRQLDTDTLDNYGRQFAVWWMQGHQSGFPERDRMWLRQEMFNLTMKDAFEHVAKAVAPHLSKADQGDWRDMIQSLQKEHPRSVNAHKEFLADRLAIDLDGNHIPGRRGSVQEGARHVGMHAVEVEAPWSIRRRKLLGLPKFNPDGSSNRTVMSKVVPLHWPIYAGEEEERLRIKRGERQFVEDGLDPIDPFPPSNPVMALNTRISNECAILACNAIVDNLDEGTGAAVIQGRSGTQPADPDTAVGGTLLFTLVCSATAFGGAVDNTGKATATAGDINDDTSADTDGTLSYCRCSSSNDGATPLDDHIDGEAAAPSGGDFNFNTLSIVSGSTVSMTSWTVSMPES